MLIKGTLMFYSETGTEGGYWALQDGAFTHTADDLVNGECPYEFEDSCPVLDGVSDVHSKYEGLHGLKQGDRLKIFNPGESRANLYWQGTVDLGNDPLFQNDVWGVWVHNQPVDIERDFWAKPFFEGYKALLYRMRR